MKKGFFYLFLLTCTSCTNSQLTTLDRYSDGQPRSVAYYPNKHDQSSCDISMYFNSGRPYKKATMKNGKFIGNKITYYKSGVIRQIDSLTQPCDTSSLECDGFLIRYNENGSISQRFTIKDNAFNGMSQHFLDNGLLVKEYELKNGMTKDGIYREFYDNGTMSFTCTFKNDTAIGMEYYFNEKGDTIKYRNHYKGVVDFPYKKWLDNGGILSGDYADKSEKSVTWTWFDKNGKLIKKKVALPKKGAFVSPD